MYVRLAIKYLASTEQQPVQDANLYYLYHPLGYSGDKKLMMSFLFFPEIQKINFDISNCLQNLYEIAKPIFWETVRKK